MTNPTSKKKSKAGRGAKRAERRLKESAKSGKLDKVPTQQTALERLKKAA